MSWIRPYAEEERRWRSLDATEPLLASRQARHEGVEGIGKSPLPILTTEPPGALLGDRLRAEAEQREQERELARAPRLRVTLTSPVIVADPAAPGGCRLGVVGESVLVDEFLGRNLLHRGRATIADNDDPRVIARRERLARERREALEVVERSKRPVAPSAPPPAPALPVEPLKRCRIRVLKSIVGFAGQVWEVGSEHEVGLGWAREIILGRSSRGRDPVIEIIEEAA
ncbi:MAG TPA: hypothetical protein VGK93_07015 [Candidatus Eisenbacteria bacterium]|jgi:hypothetical protein